MTSAVPFQTPPSSHGLLRKLPCFEFLVLPLYSMTVVQIPAVHTLADIRTRSLVLIANSRALTKRDALGGGFRTSV
jgi:hypothetical protein